MTVELVCAASDPAWLDKRREGITATDIVTIAGLVTWDSPWALYHRKLGLLPEVAQSDRMRLGSWLETSVRDYWADMHDQATPLDGALFRSSARIWQMATLDAITGNGVEDPYAPLECKTASSRDRWGPDGSDEVPAHVRAQVLWQMDTLGVGAGHVAVVFLPSGEFRSYTIIHEGNHADMQAECATCLEIDGLRDLGFGFWSRILTRRPPDLDGLEVTTDALRYLHPAPGGQAEIDAGDLAWYDNAGQHKRQADISYRDAQNRIRAALGDAHEGLDESGKVVFRRTIGKRAGYVVPPGETDTLRRIGKDKG